MKQDIDTEEYLGRIRFMALNELLRYFQYYRMPTNGFISLDESLRTFKSAADAYGVSAADFIAIMQYVAQANEAPKYFKGETRTCNSGECNCNE